MSRQYTPSAFPEVTTEWNQNTEQYEVSSFGGMTLRDYFAAKAMEALLTMAPPSLRYAVESETELMALSAYAHADAMLKAREA